jgi:DNA polymerase-1
MSAPETLPEVQAPEAAPDFAPQHMEYLRERAVPLDLARDAGLRSVTGEVAAQQLGRKLPIVGGGLSISYSGHNPPMFRIRLDLPEDNGGARYLSPGGREVPIYIPSIPVPSVVATGPAVIPVANASAQPLGDASTSASLSVPTQLSSALVVVESAIKALAVLSAGVPAVGLGGVATTLVTTKSGERRLNDSWQGVTVRGRTVIIAMDAGRASNPEVARAEARLAQALARAGAQVLVAALPLNADGEDQGPDDFLAARGPQALWAVLNAAVPADPVARATEVAALKDSKATAALLDELPFLTAVTEASPGQQRLIAEQMLKMGVKAREWTKVLSAAGERLKASGPSERKAPIGETEYAVEHGQLSIITYGKNDERHAKALCNFNAKVVEETVIDDGVEERRQLVLSGRLANGVVLPKSTLEIRDFNDPLWAQTRLSPF